MCFISPIRCWHFTRIWRHSVRLMKERRSNFPRKGKKSKIWKEKPKITFLVALVMEFFSRLRTKIHNWKICHRPILAVYPRILYIENYAHGLFLSCSNAFFMLSLRANALYDFNSEIVDPFIFIHYLSWLFIASKGLLCLADKQNNTWLFVDMEFLFPCSTRPLTRSLRSLVSYRVEHLKRNSISTHAHVLFSIEHYITIMK